MIDGRPLTISTGALAMQADGAVTVRRRYGNPGHCRGRDTRPGIDFLPLTVDYEERLYAAKDPGSSSEGKDDRARRAR
jgi:polyribonucleotide nucleotidyltransferase